jgi:glyoxylase-like metal-dependent hydrolase (beta-lactamase superfamily II)
MQILAPGVARLPVGIANVYFLGNTEGPWMLLDTGMPGGAAKIRAAAEERFGPDSKPVGIILTHGHADHAGSASELASAWDVPIYAHPLEFPYLTGETLYPPPDPTVGGPLAFLCRFFPPNGFDLRPLLQPLPPDQTVPGLPDWNWLPTPGHAPGHVSLWRESDRIVLAGDALATVDLDSLPALLTQRPQITRPPSPITCDWGAARASVQMLAALDPAILGCGHGRPMSGPTVAAALSALAAGFPVPTHGRYVSEPARTDAEGIVSLPPPAPDPLPRQLALGAALAAFVGAAFALAGRRRKAP